MAKHHGPGASTTETDFLTVLAAETEIKLPALLGSGEASSWLVDS